MKHIRSSTVVIFGAVLLAAVAAWQSYVANDPAPAAAPARIIPLVASDDAAPPGPAATPQHNTSEPATPRASELSDLLYQGYRRQPGNTLDISVSDEDAAWLHAHGFPDTATAYLLRNSATEDLERAAKSDLRAQVLLAYRLAMEGGHGRRPMDLFDDAAARGSVYALVVRANVHENPSHYRNQSMASAYYRLAFRRGQFIGVTAHHMAAKKLAPSERLMADILVETEWERLQAIRNSLGLSNFPPTDMRPELQDYLNSIRHLFEGENP